jgi:GNAT superfamily N-acetyltransferase
MTESCELLDLRREGRPVGAARCLTPQDVDRAVDLHRQHLGHEFFARLGVPFMRRYYETFLDSPLGIALSVDFDGRPAGVLVGTMRHRAHHRWVMRHRGGRLAVSGVLALLVRPRLLVHFLRTRLRVYVGGLIRFTRRSGAPRPASPEVAVVSHLITDAAFRGRGVGAELTRAFAAAAQDFASAAELVTLAPPRGAGPFYEQLGWRKLGMSRNIDGDELFRYRLPLDPSVPSSG